MPKPPPLEPVARNPLQLGAALLRFRKRVSRTQREAGERAGVKQAIVSQVESGTVGTRLGTLFKLLAALGLELVVRSRKRGG